MPNVKKVMLSFSIIPGRAGDGGRVTVLICSRGIFGRTMFGGQATPLAKSDHVSGITKSGGGHVASNTLPSIHQLSSAPFLPRVSNVLGSLA